MNAWMRSSSVRSRDSTAGAPACPARSATAAVTRSIITVRSS